MKQFLIQSSLAGDEVEEEEYTILSELATQLGLSLDDTVTLLEKLHNETSVITVPKEQSPCGCF